MLQSLHIKDFILIEKLELDFNEGFCAITGETGAGKSILLDSILFCLGERLSASPVRPSAESCSVTLIFTANERIANYLKEVDIQEDDDVLIIKTTQNIQGRKKFIINDQIVTAKLVQNLFDYLLELHGQHNHTMLLNLSSHLSILDEFGKLEPLKTEVAAAYANWQALEKKIKEIAARKDQIDKDIDYLKHVCSELESAGVKKGEEQELADIKRKLQFQDKEKELIQSTLNEIQESSIERIIAKAQRSISNSTNPDLLEKVGSNLEAAYDKIEDAKAMLQQMLRDMTQEDFSIEEIEERLYQIRSLARKHSIDSDSLGDFLIKSQEELLNLENIIQVNSELEHQLDTIKKNYFTLAEKLSGARGAAVKTLEKKVMQELSTLDMKKAVFAVEIQSSHDFASSNGVDRVRFVASTNPGMSLSPIDKIASGGELSRFMLALRVALFDNAPKQTIIFDEIDVGISGRVADSMASRLKALSGTVQIIVITHQPQVAGKADQHILVEKTQHDLHTVVKIKTLENEARSYELARMISGKEITQAGIKAAKELIQLN